MATNTSEANADGEVFRQAWKGSHPWISYGLPFPEACAKHVANTFNASRVYIIASGSLSRNTNHVKRLQDALGGKVAGVRHGMKPHTLWSEILEVTQDAKQVDADLLITLGAGSLTDAAKIIALAMANNAKSFDDLDQIHSNSSNQGSIKAPTVKIISIPTSLSGGEYSHRGGGSNDDTHRKYSFAGPIKGPSLVILDPELATTTPERWWLSTGVRAVDHCVETICSLQGTPESDADASEGLKVLVPGLLRCKKDPSDPKGRFLCQLGAVESMKASNLHGVPMGASHGISHQLGPLGVGHGETSCILLPEVCKYNRPVNAERQRKVEKVLWEQEEVRQTLEGARLIETSELGEMLDVIFRALGMPRTLKEFDIGPDKFDALAENSLHDRCAPTNPRPLENKEQVLEILEMVKG